MFHLASIPGLAYYPTVVALHCSASGASQWAPYRESLAAALIAPDLIGYAAPGECDGAGPVTLAAEAQRVATLMRAVRGPVDLVGHSYGGAVAVQTALLDAHRVRTLTLYEPVLFHLLLEDPCSAGQAREIQSIARELDGFVSAGRNDAAARVFVDYWSTPGAWDRIAPGAQQALAAKMPKVCAEFSALFDARMELDELAATGIPIRIFWGDRSPAPARRIVELLQWRLPGALIERVPGAGHMAPVNQRAVMLRLLFPSARPPQERSHSHTHRRSHERNSN
jgi:pimeloyl-ACP methyl ester carboxylesterase